MLRPPTVLAPHARVPRVADRRPCRPRSPHPASARVGADAGAHGRGGGHARRGGARALRSGGRSADLRHRGRRQRRPGAARDGACARSGARRSRRRAAGPLPPRAIRRARGNARAPRAAAARAAAWDDAARPSQPRSGAEAPAWPSRRPHVRFASSCTASTSAATRRSRCCSRGATGATARSSATATRTLASSTSTRRRPSARGTTTASAIPALPALVFSLRERQRDNARPLKKPIDPAALRRAVERSACHRRTGQPPRHRATATAAVAATAAPPLPHRPGVPPRPEGRPASATAATRDVAAARRSGRWTAATPAEPRRRGRGNDHRSRARRAQLRQRRRCRPHQAGHGGARAATIRRGISRGVLERATR